MKHKPERSFRFKIPLYLAPLDKPSKRRGNLDLSTGLPTLSFLFPRLESAISQGPIGMFYLDIVEFKRVESIYGREYCERILKAVAGVLRNMEIKFGGPRRKLGLCSLGGDDFLIFTDLPADSVSFQAEYERFKSDLEDRFNQALKSLFLEHPLQIHQAYTEILPLPDYRLEILIYKALKDVSQAAKHYNSALEHANWQLIRRIVQHQEISILYQPIISLRDGEILGYEALARGPSGSKYESAASLFAAADFFQCRSELEDICQQHAICSAAGLGDKYLFLNINPLFLNRAVYEMEIMQASLRTNNIKAEQVVLELTERYEIDDYYALRNTLSVFRNLGFKVAIDDAGAGYSSLQAIAELHPDFVKMDLSLIRDIDKSPVKRAMLETISSFCNKINAAVICEGIEKTEELQVISQIGCGYGQGFLFKKPGEITMEDSLVYSPFISSLGRPERNIHSSNQLADIAVFETPISPDTRVQIILEMFNNDKGLHGLVICQGNIPIGLLMRDRLLAMLSTRYGYDLFINRKVADIMDHQPLILPCHYGIEDAASHVVQRLEQGINDYLIVTYNDAYYGAVSVARLLDNMARIQVEQAQDANPLTRLPGNRCITRRLIDELDSGSTPIAVLYIDLDNFKAFNDYFGFEHGDRVLFMLGEIIVQAVADAGNNDDMVGHIGGDDFIVITTPDRAQAVAQTCIAYFDQQIVDLYDRESLERGYISTQNRQGENCNIPIMTISIAGVSNENHSFTNHLQLGEVAAEVKKLAKSTPGSCYYTDRRGQ